MGETGQEFFELLSSQLLQRLLKSAATSKGAKVNTDYVQKFLSCMTQSYMARGLEESTDYELASAVLLMLDPSSAPSKVMDGNTLIVGADHWISKAFALDNGKKVLKACVDNASNRAEMDGILVKIDEFQEALRQFSINGFKDTQEDTSAFGKMTLGYHPPYSF